MGNLINIDYAIIETLKAHPDFTPQMPYIYLENLTSKKGINLYNFTSKNDARKARKRSTETIILGD